METVQRLWWGEGRVHGGVKVGFMVGYDSLEECISLSQLSFGDNFRPYLEN